MNKVIAPPLRLFLRSASLSFLLTFSALSALA
jgi:hypothetical protein